MPAVTRDLKVTYNALLLGGSSNYLIDGPIKLDVGVLRGELELEVVLSLDTEVAFLVAEATLLTAWKTPRKRLLIELGLATRFDFDPALKTGFDHLPNIQKMAGKESTGRSARYRLTVAWALPGTKVNVDGRTESQFEITVAPSNLRQLRVSGTYTASDTVNQTAYEQYIDNGDTFVNATIASLLPGGIFNKVMDVANVNDTNTQCSFERVYKEVLIEEAQGILDLPYLRDQQLGITVSDTGPGDSSSGVVRPTEVSVAYDVAVDKDTRTDLPVLWRSIILPHLLNQAGLAAQGLFVGLEVTPVFSLTENKIAATLRGQVFRGTLVSLDVEVEDSIDLGLVEAAVWDTKDFSRDVYPGIKSHTRTVTVVKTSRSGGHAATTANNPFANLFGNALGIFAIPGAGAGPGHIPSPEHKIEGHFIERTNLRRKKVLFVGTVNKTKLLAEVEQRVYTRAERPSL